MKLPLWSMKPHLFSAHASANDPENDAALLKRGGMTKRARHGTLLAVGSIDLLCRTLQKYS
jgi:hypothetical protein